MATTKKISDDRTSSTSSHKVLLREEALERGIQPRLTRHPNVTSGIIHSGFFLKQSGLFKTWKWRYFVLNPQCICYFRNDKDIDMEQIEPIKRLFLNDIIDISHDTESTKRSFVLSISTKKSTWLLQASNIGDLTKWISLINLTKERDTKAEKTDPRRLSMRKLSQDTKRIILQKENGTIGCSIKMAGSYVLVSKIHENSYAARTGVLRPNDQIVEIEDVSLANKSLQEVINIIYSAPDTMLATIRPFVRVPTIKDPTAPGFSVSSSSNNSSGSFANLLSPLSPPPPLIPLPPPYGSNAVKSEIKNSHANVDPYTDFFTLPSAGELKTVLASENPMLYDNL